MGRKSSVAIDEAMAAEAAAHEEFEPEQGQEKQRLDKETFYRMLGELEAGLVKVVGTLEKTTTAYGKAIQLTITVPNTAANRQTLATLDGPEVTVTACQARMEFGEGEQEQADEDEDQGDLFDEDCEEGGEE